MQTHKNDDFVDRFLERLEERAEKGKREKTASITAGKEGEPTLAHWKAEGFDCVQRPEDSQGILRISVGGGPNTPVKLNYLTFRGDHSQCVDLLRKALKALESRDAN